jgi:hypothetical protein
VGLPLGAIAARCNSVVDRSGHFFWAFALIAGIACAGAVSYGFFVGPVKPIEWARSVPT